MISYNPISLDFEGDEITITSADDLTAIVNGCHDGTLKLIVRQQISQPKSEPVDPDLYVGVTCDGCEQPIRCIRFKCLECPDFDLCQPCERSDKHNEHMMLKVVKPKTPGYGPIVWLSRAFQHANEMANQSKNAYDSAKGAMPQPHVDLSTLGEQLTAMLGGLGMSLFPHIFHSFIFRYFT